MSRGVEGETKEWFMQLMRHEAAHAYTYAYRLQRKKKWQRIFGHTSREETPNTYRPRPFSRSYVMHLDDWYAQAHPDEDFAETFAIWLTPELDWRKRYAGWKALRKLEYVDELMRSLARLIERCDQLGLHVLNDDPQQDFRVSAFITTLVMNYLFTGKFKRTK